MKGSIGVLEGSAGVWKVPFGVGLEGWTSCPTDPCHIPFPIPLAIPHKRGGYEMEDLDFPTLDGDLMRVSPNKMIIANAIVFLCCHLQLWNEYKIELYIYILISCILGLFLVIPYLKMSYQWYDVSMFWSPTSRVQFVIPNTCVTEVYKLWSALFASSITNRQPLKAQTEQDMKEINMMIENPNVQIMLLFS